MNYITAPRARRWEISPGAPRVERWTRVTSTPSGRNHPRCPARSEQLQDVCLGNGSSQGQNLALSGLWLSGALYCGLTDVKAGVAVPRRLTVCSVPENPKGSNLALALHPEVRTRGACGHNSPFLFLFVFLSLSRLSLCTHTCQANHPVGTPLGLSLIHI